MSATVQSFEGGYDFKLDSKYRVAVPAAWRPVSGQTVNLRLLSWQHLGVPVLRVLTDKAFSAMMESIDQNETLTVGQKAQAKSSISARIEPVHMNDQGKLAVPKKLADKMGLETSNMVYLRGRITSFDLVSPRDIEAMEAAEEKALGNLFDIVGFGE
ncbi:MAG: MraZ N-terminal domain-containing protein [Verrucomicrobiota bacterium JB023]|nr:MraZ N-terminal domain-containing protein [Verrucomicrobiota bacterium JB023]